MCFSWLLIDICFQNDDRGVFISPRISELVYLDIKETDKKEKKYTWNVRCSMITAYLEVNVGVLLTAVIAEEKVKVETGLPSRSVWTVAASVNDASRWAEASGRCPTLSPRIHSSRNLEGGPPHFLERNDAAEPYICYVFIKCICSGLKINRCGLCLFLTYSLSSSILTPLCLPCLRALPGCCPGEAPERLVAQCVLSHKGTQHRVRGQPESFACWLWFGGCRHKTVLIERVNL